MNSLAAHPTFAAIKFEFTTRNGLESKMRKKGEQRGGTAWKQWRKDERGPAVRKREKETGEWDGRDGWRIVGVKGRKRGIKSDREKEPSRE